MIVRRKAKELYNLNDEDTAELVKMIKERYMGPEYDLDELINLPNNTLGYTYAKLMNTMGFQAHFYRDRARVEDESDYVTTRVCNTHDEV
jgi:ubiquinone biosynthesis protein COQ4